MKVNISQIIIKDRIRKDIGNIAEIRESLRTYGLLNPITISEEMELLAGYRRLLAAKELGWAHIECTVVKAASKLDKFQIEVEENITRKDFSDEELVLIEEEKYFLKTTGIKKLILILKRLFIKFKIWLHNYIESKKKQN